MEKANNSEEIINAIKEFVFELYDTHKTGRNNSPIDLYVRLLRRVDDSQSTTGYDKYISGFVTFFHNHEKLLKNANKFVAIPKGTVIRYGDGDKIYLEIQKYIYKAEKSKSYDELESMRNHLLNISARLAPESKNISVFDSSGPILDKMNLRPGTEEAKFITEVLKQVKLHMDNNSTENGDAPNPMEAITGLLQGGVLQTVASRIKTSVKGGAMDIMRLVGGLQTALQDIIPDYEPENEFAQTLQGFDTILEVVKEEYKNGIDSESSDEKCNDITEFLNLNKTQ